MPDADEREPVNAADRDGVADVLLREKIGHHEVRVLLVRVYRSLPP